MLIELDQSTLAYMTAALEGVCKKIPPEKDSGDLRKRIADAMIPARITTITCTSISRRASLE